MDSPFSKMGRKGTTLTEILIGIMILGIGVLSLATLFPLGLLRLKRGVNQVRGTVVARNGLNEVRVRNLLAPPLGPDATYFTRYPFWPAATPTPKTGSGVPVIIDPLWMIQNGLILDRFGLADANLTGTGAAITGGEGLLRVVGGSSSLDLASEIFSSPDDLTYRSGEQRSLPLQDAPGGGPPFLTPTYGVPFSPGSLFRERRYTWLVVARKMNARQGLGNGPDGQPGVAGVDDDGDGITDNDTELGWPGSDDTLADYGPDGVTGPLGSPAAADDPARDLATGLPVPAPVGPFEVTVIAFYTRDFASREVVYANNDGTSTATPPPPLPTRTSTPSTIFSADPRTIAVGANTFGPFGPNIATLVKRTDGVPFPEIPLESYIMDTTFDSSGSLPAPMTGTRNAFVYRVKGKTLDSTGTVLALALDQPARADGMVLTMLKGAVGVFEKQVP